MPAPLPGGQVVAGSNPVSPTQENGLLSAVMFWVTDQTTRSSVPFWDHKCFDSSSPAPAAEMLHPIS